MSYKQMKDRAAELFKSSGTLCFSDVATKLDIDLKYAVSICNRLIKEGKVRVVGTGMQSRPPRPKRVRVYRWMLFVNCDCGSYKEKRCREPRFTMGPRCRGCGKQLGPFEYYVGRLGPDGKELSK